MSSPRWRSATASARTARSSSPYVNPDGTTDLNTLARVPRDTTGDSQERDMTQAVSRLLIRAR